MMPKLNSRCYEKNARTISVYSKVSATKLNINFETTKIYQ